MSLAHHETTEKDSKKKDLQQFTEIINRELAVIKTHNSSQIKEFELYLQEMHKELDAFMHKKKLHS